MKKKTILRKYASDIVTISKGDMTNANQDMTKLNSVVNFDLNELDQILSLYDKLEHFDKFNLLGSTNLEVNNINNLNKLSNINDYIIKKKLKNEVRFIAEYSN